MPGRFLFFAYLFSGLALNAQQYPFVHYTPREGLVNNRAKFVFQDSRGRLYISTYGGLSVYDGSRFTNYTTNNGLANGLVNDIVEMGEDSLWVIPNSRNVHCLVRGRMKDFVPPDGFIPLINRIIKTAKGTYVLADDGLFLLEHSRFRKILFDPLPDGTAVRTMIQGVEADNKLYIMFNPDYKLPVPRLLVFDVMSNKVVAYSSSINPICLLSAFGKEVWISTQSGLRRLTGTEGPYPSLSLEPLPDSLHIPKNIICFFVYIDRQGNIWMATAGGVYRIRKDGEATLFSSENGLTTDVQTSIFQDIENNMWFTNEQTGLCKLSNEQLVYYPVLQPGFTVTDLFARPGDDSLWLHDAAHHRLLLRLPDGRTSEYTDPQEILFTPGRIVSGNGHWILNGNAVFRWTLTPGGHYTLTECFRDTAIEVGFSNALCDRKGDLVAVSDKLVALSGHTFLSQPLQYMADQVTVDRENRIWTATRSNQLFCFQVTRTAKGPVLSLLKSFASPVKSSPRSIAADNNGNIWVGTRDQGLFCLHFNGLKLQSSFQITVSDGLSENFISYLYCDRDNHIWACSPSGLDRIRVDNNQFWVENITRSRNLYFPVAKIQQTAAGVFWILSANGVITYRPAPRTSNGWKPLLAISGNIVSASGLQALPASQRLRYYQNNLLCQLSCPSFVDEKQTRFSYLLEGSGNGSWTTPSSDAAINLVNLPPGSYRLRARAIFINGLYANTESSLSFTILPPWWGTWWFRLAALVLAAAALMASLKFYYNRKMEKQKLVLEKRRAVEKERTRIATDMHDDLGAGLSRIKFLSETIGMKKQQHLPFEEEISSIRAYSHEMIDKMGEIVWALNEKNDTLSDLLSYTRSYAVEYLQENGIHCTVQEPDEIPDLVVSGEFRRNIYLTVKETLHNIVKHAEATEVTIHIGLSGRLKIRISDNGIGMEDTGEGRGNGLPNIRKRVQGLQGILTITGHQGTEVSIDVPLNV